MLTDARVADEPLLFALGEAAGPAAGAEQAVFLLVFPPGCFSRNAGIFGVRL